MNRTVTVFSALLFGGLLLASIAGCAGGNPFIGEAESELENQNYDEALVRVDSALAQPELSSEEEAQAYLLQAQILEQKAADSTAISGPQEHAELIRQARDAQDRAIELNPELRSDVQGRRQLAYIQEMQLGADAFNRANETQNEQAFRAAAAYFDAAGAIYPDSANAHLNEAYALINADDQPGAIGPLEDYVQRVDTVGADQYTLLGQLYLTNDRADDAIDPLREAINEYPDNGDLQSLLVNAYQQTGRSEDAMELYRNLVEQNPDDALYRYNLGSLLLNTEEYDEAIEQLNRAVEIDPNNANAQYNLGAAHVNKAVAVNDEIRAVEDSLRAGDDLSPEERQELDQQASQFAEERQQLFEDAIPPLERARQLAQTSDDANVQRICDALYTAYVQTEQMEKAQEVEGCSSQ